MKQLVFSLLIFLFTTNCLASDSNELYPMQKNFQWGYINSNGNWQIEPEFDWATTFHEERAFVSDSSGRIYVINLDGEIVFEYISNNWAMTTEYGVRITSGPDRFHECLVHKDNGVYYDKNGNEILDAGCEYCYNFGEFYDNRALVEKQGKWGYINKSGKVAISPEFDDAKHFFNGLAPVAKYIDKEKKWGFIDTTGKVIIPLVYRKLEHLNNGLAQFHTKSESRSGGYYSLVGFINQKGDTAISPQFKPFDIQEKFSEGLFPAEVDDKYGYIDTSGKYIINPAYEEAESFSEGIAFVVQETKNQDKQFFIDKNGEVAISNKLIDSAVVVWPFKNGLAKLGFNLYGNNGYSASGSGEYKIYSNTYYGYVNKKGNIVKVQSKEERNYMRSVIDSIKNAEKIAEQRKEEREQNRINKKLKDCPDFIEYGDDNLSNKLIFNVNGKKRILYFDSAILEKRLDNQSQGEYLYIPLFGLTKKDKERLKEKSGGGWFSGMFDSFYDDMSKIKLSLKPGTDYKFEFEDKSLKYIDCMDDIPGEVYDEIWNKYNSKRSLNIEEKSGSYSVIFKSTSGKVDSNYVQGIFKDLRVINTNFKSSIPEKISQRENTKVRTVFPEFIEYYPEQNLIKYPGSGFSNYETLKLPDDKRDRFYKRSDSYLTIYKIITLSEEEIHIEEHEINLIENDKKWKNSIFLPPYSDNISIDKYDLNDSTLREIIYSQNTIPLEMKFLIMQPDKVPDLLPKLNPSSEQQKYSDVDFKSKLKLNSIEDRNYIMKKISTYTVAKEANDENSNTIVEKTHSKYAFSLNLDGSNCDDCFNLIINQNTSLSEIRVIKTKLRENLNEEKYNKLIDFTKFASSLDENKIMDYQDEITQRIKDINLDIEISDNFMNNIDSFRKKISELSDYNDEILEVLINSSSIETAKKLVPFYKDSYSFNTTNNNEKKETLISRMEEFVSNYSELPEYNIGDSIDINTIYEDMNIESETSDEPNMKYIDIDFYQKLLSKTLENKYSQQAQKFARLLVKSYLDKVSLMTNSDFKPTERSYTVEYKYRVPPVEVNIEYLDNTIKLTSETPSQGKDTKEIKKPEDIYDIYQLQTVIASLPLETGFKDSLAFFDIYEEKTVSFSTDEGTDYMLRLKPMYLKANIEVLGLESVQIDDEKIDSYKLKVLFKGDFSNHPLIKNYKSLFYDKESGQGYAYFYITEEGEFLKMEKEDDIYIPLEIES